MKLKPSSQAYLVICHIFNPIWVLKHILAGLHFSSMALLLHLPVGVLRLITHKQLLAFTASPSCVTVIKQQSVLICGYVHSNQLRLEIREGGGGRDRKRGEKDTPLQSFLTFHPHIWHSLKHTHIYTITDTYMHTDRLPLSPSLSVM